MTRTDDVINVAGHRLSTGAMEEVKKFIYIILNFLIKIKYITIK